MSKPYLGSSDSIHTVISGVKLEVSGLVWLGDGSWHYLSVLNLWGRDPYNVGIHATAQHSFDDFCIVRVDIQFLASNVYQTITRFAILLHALCNFIHGSFVDVLGEKAYF